jgi:hypothetical protein
MISTEPCKSCVARLLTVIRPVKMLFETTKLAPLWRTLTLCARSGLVCCARDAHEASRPALRFAWLNATKRSTLIRSAGCSITSATNGCM